MCSILDPFFASASPSFAWWLSRDREMTILSVPWLWLKICSRSEARGCKVYSIQKKGAIFEKAKCRYWQEHCCTLEAEHEVVALLSSQNRGKFIINLNTKYKSQTENWPRDPMISVSESWVPSDQGYWEFESSCSQCPFLSNTRGGKAWKLFSRIFWGPLSKQLLNLSRHE